MSVIVQPLAAYTNLTPLQASDPELFPFLLQSVAHGSAQARFDILFACPQQSLVINKNFCLDYPAELAVPVEPGFLAALNAWWLQLHTKKEDISIPFRGGWFIYLGYELAQEIEPILRLPVSKDSLPVAFATRIPVALINDTQTQQTYLVYEPEFAEQARTLENIVLDSCNSQEPRGEVFPAVQIAEETPAKFLDGVERIRRYIVEGDVFQVNLSRAWTAHAATPINPLMLYQRLSRTNPAPFAGLLHWRKAAIISSSPERLLRRTGAIIETRPIAGTRPRAQQRPEDQALLDELITHPKERAEHVMLVDLERNDLGRVCVAGSVKVDELMALETYAHVHHITSNIQGVLRPGILPGDIIKAVFPGGTITGCPKVRCMQIISEIEGTGRSFYTGSCGYLNRDGDMDLNILIRTLLLEQNKIMFRAGAGIVYDSIAEKELEETRAKAKGFLQVFSTAER